MFIFLMAFVGLMAAQYVLVRKDGKKMFKNNFKRTLSFVMAIALCFGLFGGVMPASDVTINATFEEKPCTITFNKNDDTEVSTVDVTKGSTVSGLDDAIDTSDLTVNQYVTSEITVDNEKVSDVSTVVANKVATVKGSDTTIKVNYLTINGWRVFLRFKRKDCIYLFKSIFDLCNLD